MSSIYKDCCTVWTGWLQEGATGQVAGFWPPVGEGEGVQEAGTVTSTGVDITALTCSGDGGGVQEAQLVTRGQGAVSLDTRLNGVTIATQTLALD